MPLSRRSGSDWEGEGSVRSTGGEVLRTRRWKEVSHVVGVEKLISIYQIVTKST